GEPTVGPGLLRSSACPPTAFLTFACLLRRPPRPPLFPYTTLFRSGRRRGARRLRGRGRRRRHPGRTAARGRGPARHARSGLAGRSEEHTSELQSRENLVCRLLLEKKKNNKTPTFRPQSAPRPGPPG